VINNPVILEILFIVLTASAYLSGKLLYRKTGFMLFHTVITATILIIIFCNIFSIDIRSYESNSKFINYLLNLSVVALGYLLYKEYDFIRSRGAAILSATFFGSLAAILSVAGISLLMGARYETIITLLPKSITTPIAIVLSGQSGGMVSLTAVIVILSGIFGAVVGPWFFKITGIKTHFAKGLALGSAAHGIGTAKALEMGALEGAAGGLAIALMGFFTSVLMPMTLPFIKIISEKF
jgi:putative effector of murein hydrolase